MSHCTTSRQRWVIVLYMCLSRTAVPKATFRIVIDNLIVSSRVFSVVFAVINEFAQRCVTAHITYCATSSWSLNPSRNSSASPTPHPLSFLTSHFFVPAMFKLPHLLFPFVFISLPFLFLSCRSFYIYVLSFFLSFILSFFLSFILSFFLSFFLSFIHSFIHSFFPSFILSFFHSFFLSLSLSLALFLLFSLCIYFSY